MRVFNENKNLILEAKRKEGKLNLSPSGIRRELEAEKKRKKKLKEKKLKKKDKEQYNKYLERVQDYKEKRQAWLEGQTAKNEEERKNKSKPLMGKGEVISSKDADPTATRKAISNVASVAGALAKVGVKALSKRMQQKSEKVKKPPTSPSSTQKMLPPARPIAGALPSRSSVSLGQRAKKDPYLRRKLTTERGGINTYKEEYVYSCWREEFLSELGQLRQKVKSKLKDDPIIDIMKGENKVIINPNVSESVRRITEGMNGASIFAKATPPLKQRTTPMSDVFLAKQPGKKSSEQIQKIMQKLFLGDRSNFYSNYDLSGHSSDGSDVESTKNINSESYNEDDGIPELRSRTITDMSSTRESDTRRSRTTAVLKAMAAMNPPKAKKKKKKKEQ